MSERTPGDVILVMSQNVKNFHFIEHLRFGEELKNISQSINSHGGGNAVVQRCTSASVVGNLVLQMEEWTHMPISTFCRRI